MDLDARPNNEQQGGQEAGPSRLPYPDRESSRGGGGQQGDEQEEEDEQDGQLQTEEGATADHGDDEEDDEVLYYVDEDGNRVDPSEMDGYTVQGEVREGDRSPLAQDSMDERGGGKGDGGSNGDSDGDGGGTGGVNNVKEDTQHTEEAMVVDGSTDDQGREGGSMVDGQEAADTRPGEGGEDADASQTTDQQGGHHHDQQQQRFPRPYRPKRRQRGGTTNGDTPDRHGGRVLPDFTLRYQVTGHRKHVSAVQFSEDGKWLATAGADGRVLLFSLSPETGHGGTPHLPTPPKFIRSYTLPDPPPPPKSKSGWGGGAGGAGAGAVASAASSNINNNKTAVPPVGSCGISDIKFSPVSPTYPRTLHLAIASDDNLVRILDVYGNDKTSATVNSEGVDRVLQELDKIGRKPKKKGGQEEGDAGAVPNTSTGTGRDADGPSSQVREQSSLTNPHDAPLNGNGSSTSAPTEEVDIRIFRGHTSFVFCLSYSPQGNLLASASFDETIRIWDVKRGRCLKVLPAHSDPVSGINFSRDGSLLCSCGHDGLLRLWDASTGQCLKTLVDEANPPASFTLFTPNSRYILTNSLDSTIRLWDYHTGICVKSYTGHKNVKYHIPALFLLPSTSSSHHDDQGGGLSRTGGASSMAQKHGTQDVYIVAGSEDGKILFWDLQTRHVVKELEGHQETVLCLALEPHSGMMATASLDKDHTVKIWVDASRRRLADDTQA